jgi:adenylate kinase
MLQPPFKHSAVEEKHRRLIVSGEVHLVTIAAMSTGSLSAETLEYFKAKNIQSILDEALHNLVQAMPDDPLKFLEDALRSPTPLRVILLGPPGSGKSTLAAKLAERYGAVHIDASPNAAKGEVMAAADILPRITEVHKSGKGWVLDGFPETRADTIQLQVSGVSPQRVFELQAPVSTTMARIANNGSEASHASESTIRQRYRYYDMRKTEVAAAYRTCYVELSANGSSDELMEEVMKEIDALSLS